MEVTAKPTLAELAIGAYKNAMEKNDHTILVHEEKLKAARKVRSRLRKEIKHLEALKEESDDE